MSKDSIFKKLSEIDISTMVKQKGQFWYMPWANAVREVTKHYPEFTWEFTEFDGLPFLETKLGFFVECTVTIENVSRKQMMPVLDFKNQTNMSPKANDINKSQMRALAKAISLHGLGLDLWAGEDLIGYEEPANNDLISQEQHDTLFSLLCDQSGAYTEKGTKIAAAFKFNMINELPANKYEEVLKVAS